MNILLTCAGRRNYIVDYFKAALAPFGGKVFAANSEPAAAALVSADIGFLVPNLYDPAYIDALIHLCGEYDIRAIIPLFDLELPVLAAARGRLADNGIRVLVSPPEVIDICNDKRKTNDFLVKNDFSALRTYTTLESALEALASGELVFPLMVKPRWGLGSIGMLEAEDEGELRVLFGKAQRLIARSYLATVSGRDPAGAVLIQEKARGEEYGLDVINDLQGRYVTTLVKKKLAMRSGETDSAMTVDEPRLRRLGERLSARLGHVGNLDVDVFLDEKGACVLEMNPRFGGGYPFSHLAGADLPAAIVAWLREETPSPTCFQIAYNVIGVKGIQPMRVVDAPRDYRQAVEVG